MATTKLPGSPGSEQTARFNEAYKARTSNPTFLEIEKQICGCGYGSTSWTTQGEADEMLRHLNMSPQTKLLDIGSGAGWPALYFAGQSGCDVTLSDLPFDGLAIAVDRAAKDGMGERSRAAVASAAELPFAKDSFDAITHSDVLCCLEPKIETLEACRRVIKPAGTMAFSVIYFAPGLTSDDQIRALAGAPLLTGAPAPYEDMLSQTGWRVTHRSSLRDQFRKTAIRLKELEEANREELEKVWGDETDAIISSRSDYVYAIENGLTERDLFVAEPA